MNPKRSILILIFCMAFVIGCNNNNNTAKVTEDTTAAPDGTVNDTSATTP